MAIREVSTIDTNNRSRSSDRSNQEKTEVNKKTMSQNIPPSSSGKSKVIENVLILQGGGSLGAFGCGVFKALCEKNVKVDIAAGTSIGGVNAAIIAGGKDGNRPEHLLEQFWLELADGFVDLENIDPFLTPYMESLMANFHYFSPPGTQQDKNESKRKVEEYTRTAKRSFLSSAMFGNDKMFKARWRPEYVLTDPQYFEPEKWTYLYDHSPLAVTLQRYIDYDKLKPNGNSNSRLIVTAVNVLTSEPLTFDSYRQPIYSKHILATSGYPVYYFPWVEVEEGVYAWDGGLLSNTPLREVIDASPVVDKKIFLVENYPKRINSLPDNLAEVLHRTRDIIFCDKSLSTVQISKAITSYLRYIDELYQTVEEYADLTKIDKDLLKKIRRKYKKYKQDTGAEIKGVYYISREEQVHSIYENADFSPKAIKDSIKEGELKTTKILEQMEKNK
jgi:NTE family protein